MGDLSKNFKQSEFACKCGCGFDLISHELVETLQELRDAIKKPIIIVSGCRCPDHNAEVGGVSNSAHLVGQAADIMVNGWDATTLGNKIKGLHKQGLLQKITYCYLPGRNTVHIGIDHKPRSKIFGW